VGQTQSPDTEEVLREALCARYSLLECCGEGGMGRVYRARDLRHHRDVAVKVLPRDLSNTLAVDRFLREIRIAASLSHPHILPLFDSGEAAGMLYYVMPYENGPTLRSQLDDRGPLPRDKVIRLGMQLADALHYAHERGIVHRDVKPGNIFLQGDHGLLADFGLARAIRAAGDRQLTSDQCAVGTPMYMSPEQAIGGPDVDGRSDIYSLGCVLFEALTGDTAAAPVRETVLGCNATLAERRHDRLSGAPAPLRRALEKAMAPLPSDRFATAAEFGKAISATGVRLGRAMAIGAACVTAAIGAFFGVNQLPHVGSDRLAPRRVVVATLGNQTGVPELSALGEMAADWATQGLQRSGLAIVVPTPTVRSIERAGAEMGTDPLRAVATQTHAALVVSGDIYRQDDSLVVHVQLTDVRQNRVVGSIDPVVVPLRGSRDALMIEVRSRVMGLVGVHLDERIANAPGSSGQPPAFEAYRRFNDGLEQYSLNRSADAIPHFRAAHELDTGFVQARLFEALMLSNVGRWGEADSLLRLVEVRRDELSRHDQYWLDYRRMLLAGRRDEALRFIREAARLAPQSRASYNLAVEAMEAGRLQEALASLARLQPDRGVMRGFVPYLATVATLHHLLSRHDEEAKALARMRELYPEEAWVVVLEAGRLAAVAQPKEAAEFVRRLERTNDARWSAIAAARYVADELRVHGQPQAARTVLAQSLTWWESQPSRVTDSFAVETERIEVLRRLGRFSDANAALERLLAQQPDNTTLRTLAGVLAVLRRDTAAKNAADVWLANRQDRYLFGLPDLGRARIAAVAGDRARAITLLQSARSAGRPLGIGLHQEPDFASLRGSPAFDALVSPWQRR
jgi:tetratricopeptide (TPR) repeat protein